MAEEIITALATAWGEGGIAIVRVSGEGCASLVDKMFRAKRRFSEQPARYMALGTLHAKDGTLFDEVLAVLNAGTVIRAKRAPKYTVTAARSQPSAASRNSARWGRGWRCRASSPGGPL